MGLAKYVPEGGSYAPGHGHAYREWHLNRSVTYPIPLNIVVGLARKLYLWATHAVNFKPTPRELELLLANVEGARRGRLEGYEQARLAIAAHLSEEKARDLADQHLIRQGLTRKR